MLEILSKGFRDVKNHLQGKRTLTEDNLGEALQMIRVSLLEADVEFQVARSFLERVKEKAHRATLDDLGGARLVCKYLADWFESQPSAEVHIIAHSAGSIFCSPLVKLLTTRGNIRSGYLRGGRGYGIPLASCSLWAPSIRLREFKQTYAPAIRSGGIQRFTLYTLSDEAEREDNCAQIYNKSLLQPETAIYYILSLLIHDRPYLLLRSP